MFKSDTDPDNFVANSIIYLDIMVNVLLSLHYVDLVWLDVLHLQDNNMA